LVVRWERLAACFTAFLVLAKPCHDILYASG
jgi:hypothetical protein